MKRNTTIRQHHAGALALALLGLGSLGVAQADQQVTAKFAMPLQVHGTVTASDCNNSPGPVVTLEGEITLGGMQAEIIFQNNQKGTHKASVTTSANVILVPLGEAITLPKQPVLGGVGGNPHIWIQFHDGAGNNLTEEIYLGRCVQGFKVSPGFLNQVIAATDIIAIDCKQSPGPFVTVGGTLTLSGLHARFIFRNNVKGTHTAEDIRDVSLIGGGSQIVIPKQPVLGGAGGNPLISVQFLQGNGELIGDLVPLGRCNKL